ncbi:MAG TPA: ABC transporter substrate-binding protein [Anaerolineae bacterium]|nr:ABC transporter substrate-binding protein [Anaerolineae bacterium]HQK14600.1 ABC transporter substrate-binding protein [Anaerolineae bacterium]
MRRIFVVWLLVVLLATGCAAKATPEPKALVFMAGYRPQANLPFVGVYVAQEKGFFAEESLTVDIQHTAGKGEHLQLLVAGTVDITTQDAAVLLKRRADPGLPLVSIALIGQRGQQAFVALKESGMQTPQDWAGHKIGFKGTPPPDLLALLDVAGLTENDVELINVGFDPRVLVEGLVDVYPVYNSNEPYLLQSWGYELVQWEAADYGIPTLGLTYVTTPDKIAQDPERIQRFLRAALRGIAYAESHVDEAVDIVLKYTGPETDRAHMRFMLETELADAHSALTDEHGIGWQTEAQWQALMDSLLQYGALAGPVEVKQVFTNQFLEGARKK